MFKLWLLAFAIASSMLAESPEYAFGRAPTKGEVKAWDISVAPDGTGLPESSGTPAQAK
jgi:cytochrome c